MQQSFLPISKLVNQPYSSILGFPKATKKQLLTRLVELKKIGVKSISFEGDTLISTLNVLGKGYVGIVVLAKMKNKKVAVKIRRTDSPRTEMENEAHLLDTANKANVGPKLIDSSRNFIVMEYLEGKKIGDWMKELDGKGKASKLKSVARKVLEDCYNLDAMGLDHGELSSITKHVIVGKKTELIDFESSSTKRLVSNVTSATQGLYIGSGISKMIKRIYKIPSKEKIIGVLRIYKKEKTRENFDKVLSVLKL
jgi:putative serine/threonine protein kinase